MKRAVLVVALIAGVSCGKSEESTRIDRLALRANPAIAKLQPSVAIVLQPGADPKAVRKACLQAVADSAPLEIEKFDDRRGDEEVMGIDDVFLSFAMKQSDTYCKEDTGDGTRDARCVRWCTEMFRGLTEALDRFHKKHPEINTLTK